MRASRINSLIKLSLFSFRDYLLHPSPFATKIKIAKNDASSEKAEKKEKKVKKVEMSESRKKKFYKLFGQKISSDECLINYFSCALVADILLQGHLYISENYFSFYSNVFGYVTKLVIPISTVTFISKEKTAKMFPNAIGIQLPEAKHVFGSFLSRETAYQLMLSMTKKHQVTVTESGVKADEVDCVTHEVTESSKEDSSSLSSESPPQFNIPEVQIELPQPIIEELPKLLSYESVEQEVTHIPVKTSPPPPSVDPPRDIIKPNNSKVLFVGIFLTLILAFFSAFLLVRINNIESSYKHTFDPGLSDFSKMTIEEAEQVLNRNLMTVRNVREKLEELQTILQASFKENSHEHEL